jgi:hypothetical protein
MEQCEYASDSLNLEDEWSSKERKSSFILGHRWATGAQPIHDVQQLDGSIQIPDVSMILCLSFNYGSF